MLGFQLDALKTLYIKNPFRAAVKMYVPRNMYLTVSYILKK